jgi:hypothetical protein
MARAAGDWQLQCCSSTSHLANTQVLHPWALLPPTSISPPPPPPPTFRKNMEFRKQMGFQRRIKKIAKVPQPRRNPLFLASAGPLFCGVA